MNKILIHNFPFFGQLDNEFNPTGACNVTSVAMCLHHLGIRGDASYPQLEDQMYQRCIDRGWSRHDPHGLKLLAESYPNIKDDFTDRATLKDIKEALTSNKPCVIHGYFTRFGHIIVAKGFTNRHLIVNDPYGEWFDWGYDTSVSGEELPYSWGMISRLCSPESVASPKHIWLHRFSRTD
jgi:uncharacterized protein YvpB